ncbi:MAG: diguanylate cyclase [Gammaproteobacteria bacterium]|nr:diguanylate cyclase [Gammaproteobacteria bacterium]MDP2140354.1 diguanylate cyclase [Gammaproteobacteria bacterium]MDP2346129.1 diguanylate cyclase [Gammaproteobacteria bacterium]
MLASKFKPFIDFMDLLLDAICVVDVEGRFVFVSAACERIFGYTPQEMLGHPMIELVHPEDRERTLATAEDIISGNPQFGFENRYIRKDGRIVHIRWSARWSEADQVRVAVAHDITERKRSEMMQAALYAISEAANAAEDLLELFSQIHRIVGELLPAANFFVALYDEENDELSFPYFVDELDEHPLPRPLNSGTLSAEVIRSGQALLLTPETRSANREQADSIVGSDSLDWLGVPLKSQKRTIGALVVQTYSGAVRYTEEDKELLQFVSTQIASAISRTQLHARLLYAAGHDPLTGLANRGLFQDRLESMLARVRREHARFALLYIDLDKFKNVNDTYGHAIGDLLLQEVAERLRACVRESDTIARVGGDEFVVLLNTIVLPFHATIVARKIRAALSKVFQLQNQKLFISPSIGVAVYPEDGDDEVELLRRADEDMYSTKKNTG